MSSTQAIKVFILFCLSYGFAYNSLGKWRLTSDNVEDQKFKDLSPKQNEPFRSKSDSNGYITTGISCACFNSSGVDYFYSTINSASDTAKQFGISVWINVPAAPIGGVFAIGNSVSSLNYYLHMVSGFVSKFDMTSSSVIPKEKWVFLAFCWKYSSSVWQWDIYSPDLSSVITSTYFANPAPGNYIIIGFNKVALYYEIQAFISASIDKLVVTLSDNDSSTYIATTGTCANSCSNYCYPDVGCLSTGCCPTLCNCPAYDGVCASCKDSSYEAKTLCQCKIGYVLSGSSCVIRNFYTAPPPNCVIWNSPVCTQCESNYFLYDNSTSSTTICLGIFYLACNSCTTCNASPNCYKCADLIVKDGNTCRVDSIGYQLSFDSPNIIIDFAHQLSKDLKMKTFSATTETHQDIPTTSWKISPSSTAKQYQIVTDLTDDKLPIDIDFSFEQIS